MTKKATKTTATANPAPFMELVDEMNHVILEREEPNLGCIVGLISGHNVFELGKPGTAKTQQVKFMAAAIGGRFWEGLGHPFATPEEFLGPYALSGLKEDKYRRNTENTILDCDVAYLDEGFKTNPSTLQVFLPIINEREYRENGVATKIPLRILLVTSNELPTDDQKENLSAFWDRLVLRFVTGRLVEEDNVSTMIQNYATNARPTPSVSISMEDVELAAAAAASLEVPLDVVEAIVEVRRNLKAQGIEPSDRKMCQVVDIIRAHAWLHGRDKVSTADLIFLKNVLWEEPSQIPIVTSVILDVANPILREVSELFDGVLQAWQNAQASGDTADKMDVHSKATEALDYVKSKAEDLPEDEKESIRPMYSKVKDIVEKIATELLGGAASDL